MSIPRESFCRDIWPACKGRSLLFLFLFFFPPRRYREQRVSCMYARRISEEASRHTSAITPLSTKRQLIFPLQHGCTCTTTERSTRSPPPFLESLTVIVCVSRFSSLPVRPPLQASFPWNERGFRVSRHSPTEWNLFNRESWLTRINF